MLFYQVTDGGLGNAEQFVRVNGMPRNIVKLWVVRIDINGVISALNSLARCYQTYLHKSAVAPSHNVPSPQYFHTLEDASQQQDKMHLLAQYYAQHRVLTKQNLPAAQSLLGLPRRVSSKDCGDRKGC